MPKPVNLALWSTVGTKTEPSGAEKAAGWSVGDKPPAQWMNWWMNLIYTWVLYLDGIETYAHTWASDAEFQVGINVYTDGSGATGNDAIVAVGGGAAGRALVATGGSAKEAITALGGGIGAGIVSTGGASAGIGVDATGGAGGRGMKATGGAGGGGLQATAGAAGPYGAQFVGTNATGGATGKKVAVELYDGFLWFPVSPAVASTDVMTNLFSNQQFIRAHVLFTFNTSVAPTINGGVHIASVVAGASSTVITFAAALPSGVYTAIPNLGDNSSAAGYSVKVLARTTTTISVVVRDTAGAIIDPRSALLNGYTLDLMCLGG